jgi:hypothetical protein
VITGGESFMSPEYVKNFPKGVLKKIRECQPKLDSFVPLVVAEYSTSNEHSIADCNVAGWYNEFLQESLLKSSESAVMVKFSNELMFNQLRLGVKKGEIKNLGLMVNGEIFYVVLPNGKSIGGALPCSDKILGVWDEQLVELI